MGKYADIIYRLARVFAWIPPELFGALLIAILWHPAALINSFVYVVDLLIGEVVWLLLLSIWTWFIWPRLLSTVRNAILRLRDFFLPASASCSADDLLKKNAELEARVEELEHRLEISDNAARGHPSDQPQAPTDEDD